MFPVEKVGNWKCENSFKKILWNVSKRFQQVVFFTNVLKRDLGKIAMKRFETEWLHKNIFETFQNETFSETFQRENAWNAKKRFSESG